MAKAFVCEICDDFVEGQPHTVDLCKRCHKEFKQLAKRDGKKHPEALAETVPEAKAEPVAATPRPRGRPKKVVAPEPPPEAPQPRPRGRARSVQEYQDMMDEETPRKKPGILVKAWQKLIGSDVE